MTNTAAQADRDIDIKKFDQTSLVLKDAQNELRKVIYGQDEVIEQILVTLLAGGHVLLMGVPGLAKTLMVESIAKVLGLDTNRVQCTPDLMPADIIGSEVLEESPDGKRSFRFIKGPVFTQFLMADEINRASPRTQSALLQAMQEKTVSAGGADHKLPIPFHVLATQNPLEQEGTYPLPEAQLDRFLMQIDVVYPDETAEKQIIMATTGNDNIALKTTFKKNDLIEAQTLVRDMPVSENVIAAILKIVRNARPSKDAPDIVNNYVSWPPGPRASQALTLAVRARALLQGRHSASVDDAIALAEPILKHRMALHYQARADGMTIKDVVSALCRDI